MMLLPFLNKLENLKEKLIFLRKIILISICFLIPFLGVVYLWSEKIILLLFSKEFLYVVNFLVFQFVGDVFKVSNIAIGFLFLSNSWVKEYILIELLSFTGFVTLSAILINTLGESGIGIAYIANSAFIMVAMFTIIYSKYTSSRVF